MNFLITGATGFIGSALCSRLLADQHHIVVISRRPELIEGSVITVSDTGQLESNIIFDVVINLAGEPIADKRWSKQQKKRIFSSRIDTTRQLVEYFKSLEHKPKLLISGSAIGYYGIDKTDNDIDETATADDSFSSQLCQQWEITALQAQALGIRTCLLRTGIVLGEGGGALRKMLPPFKMGLGGKIGDGSQWMSWIHLGDLIGIILLCINQEGISGPVNGTSPNPVTNQVFTKTLGKVLKRPTFFTMPAVIIKLLMGQMGEELLLKGKKILPQKVLKSGYQFKYKTLENALMNIMSNSN